MTCKKCSKDANYKVWDIKNGLYVLCLNCYYHRDIDNVVVLGKF